MTIEIDDTAWGLPVGGIWLGFHRIETKEIVIKEIDVNFFRIESFKQKMYLDESLRKAKRALFKDMDLKSGEPIHICRGYVLSSIYKWLISRGFDCEHKKIVGTLQDKMEEVSRLYVSKLPNFKKNDSESLYDALIKWIEGDLNNRLHFVKTGWKSIQKKLWEWDRSEKFT